MDKIELARDVYATLDRHGIEACVKLTLRGAAVPPALERQAREVADELRLLVAARALFPQNGDAFVDELRSRLTSSADGEVVQAARASLPCTRCSGSGREPSALDQFSQIEYLLRSLMWADGRIALLRDEIRADEALVAVRWGGLDLRSPYGSQRTLAREH